MRFISSLRKFGFKRVAQTILSIVEDYIYDFKYQIDTFEKNKVTGEDPDKIEADFYFRYQPTRFRHFRKLMQQIHFPLNTVFVDVGSGKGKVLLMASEYGFKEIVGIEKSVELCQIAEKNIHNYQKKKGVQQPIQIIETDILLYKFKGNEQVFYLFNPFNNEVMKTFIEMLEISIQKNPRKVWLIFNNFKNSDLFHDSDVFHEALCYVYAGTHFTVFLHK